MDEKSRTIVREELGHYVIRGHQFVAITPHAVEDTESSDQCRIQITGERQVQERESPAKKAQSPGARSSSAKKKFLEVIFALESQEIDRRESLAKRAPQSPSAKPRIHIDEPPETQDRESPKKKMQSPSKKLR